MGRPSSTSRVSLSDISVRPVRDGAERAEWDRLMDAHHYLGFRCLFGGGVRHVAEMPGGRWLALLGWVAAAFKVKARDDWIGWAPEQQFRRLHLVANNTHAFPDPSGLQRRQPGVAGAVAVAAPAVGGLRGAARPSGAGGGDLRGPLAVRRRLLPGGDWTLLGETRGYARDDGGWAVHGTPKQVYARALGPRARAALGGRDEPVLGGAGRGDPEPPAEDRLRSL